MDSQTCESRSEQNEGRLSSGFLDAVPDWIWEVDAAGVISYSNAVVTELLGRAAEHVVGLPMIDLLTPEDRPDCREAFDRAVATKQPARSVVGHFEALDGRVATIELSCVPILDEAGKPIGLRGIGREITQHTLLQRAADETAENYRLVLDNSLTGIVIIQNERFVYANSKILNLTGYTLEEAYQMGPWQVVHPDDVERVKDYYGRRMAGKEAPEQYQVRVLNKSGAVRHIELRTTRISYRGAPAVLENLIDITERIQDEERFHRHHEAIATGVVVSGADGTITHANEVASELLGVPPNDLAGRLVSDAGWQALREDGSPMPAEELPCSIVLRTGEEVRNVVIGVGGLPGGQPRWLLVSATPIAGSAGGEFVELLTTFVDITALVEAREKLRQRSDEMEAVLNAFPDLYFWLDPHGTILDYHAVSESVLYERPEAFLGRSVQSVLPSDAAQSLERAMDQLAQSVSVAAVEYTLPLAGDERSFECRLSPLPDGRIIAVVRDITERKRSESAMRESEERYRLLFERSPDMLFAILGDRFVAVNPAVKRLLGYEPEEVIGLTPWDISPEVQPDGVPSIEKARTILTGMPDTGPRTFEWVHQRKDGTPVECDVSLNIYKVRGQPYVQAIVRDITERKRAEEHRRALQRQLEAQKRQFYRETILSVTAGKLDVCEAAEIRPYISKAALRTTIEGAKDVGVARHAVQALCSDAGLDGDRLLGFMIGVGEAMTNAVKHASGGKVYAGSMGDSVWVGVADGGSGIGSLVLPRATLLRGFSTKPSLGLGYTIMLEVADHIMLKTGARGTTVILVKQIAEPQSELSPGITTDDWQQLCG